MVEVEFSIGKHEAKVHYFCLVSQYFSKEPNSQDVFGLFRQTSSPVMDIHVCRLC